MRIAAPAFLVAMTAAAHAFAGDSVAGEPDAYYGSDPRQWGQPHVIVAPDYPADALASHVTGTVHVSGVIAPMGNLEDIAYSVDPPTATALVDALKEVMPRWVFYPSVAKTCLPSSDRVLTQVWFEIRDGEPHISVSRGGVPAPPEAGASQFKALTRVEPRYPRQMIREGRQSHVYARMEVDAAGTVTRVTAKAYPPARGLGPFETESEEALMLWKFPPAQQGMSRPRILCYDIVYRLRD